jgi:NADPH:quinone reductase-like Zn-dependent oxidoreductase
MEKKETMKAAMYRKFGLPTEVFELLEVDKPGYAENEVLVKVHAASVQFADWAFTRGKPFIVRLIGAGLFKPKNPILGSDIAGRIEAVGENVEKFRSGDEVFGELSDCGWGGFAEYVSVPESVLTMKPANLSFDEAAAIPQAATVALQGLRNKGKIQPGQKVLVNGASGGIGSFAIQIAKSFGAEVTGVCSTINVNMIRSIGADHVIDYTQCDFTKEENRYDLIFDMVVNHSISDYVRVLNPKGIYVAGAMSWSAVFLGPLYKLRGSKEVGSLAANTNVEDLEFLTGLIEAGKVAPVIDSRYPLKNVAEALEYYGERHAKGKVVITIAPVESE